MLKETIRNLAKKCFIKSFKRVLFFIYLFFIVCTIYVVRNRSAFIRQILFAIFVYQNK